jgi:hypothetical protein
MRPKKGLLPQPLANSLRKIDVILYIMQEQQNQQIHLKEKDSGAQMTWIWSLTDSKALGLYGGTQTKCIKTSKLF